MSVLVIKAWRADTKPIDNDNNFVSITGRKSGLIAWLFSLMRIDPTTRVLIGTERIEFSSASWAGSETRLIPLECVCSSYFGYHKPWKAAVTIVIAFLFFGSSLATSLAERGTGENVFARIMLAFAVGLIVALVYYFLNRTLTLGFVEHSGLVNGIRFKRSVIENMDINERQAASVTIIVQRLIEAKRSRPN